VFGNHDECGKKIEKPTLTTTKKIRIGLETVRT
jgi:hypothetical protein